MDFFDRESAPEDARHTADGLEQYFAYFRYFGPMVQFGSPCLLIDTDLGKCRVSTLVSTGPFSHVSLAVNGEKHHLAIYEAIQFLRANGAKSDWDKS